MSTLSLAALFEALDIPCREALEQAAVSCAGRGGYEIAIDDYLECLLPLAEMRDILAQFGCNEDALRELLSKNRPVDGHHSGRPSFSPLLYQLLQEAYLLATLELRRERIGAGSLVLALLRNPVRYSVLPFYKELKKISADELFRLLEGLYAEQHPSRPADAAKGTAGALAQYAVDFTEEARKGGIDPVFARGPEIRLVVDILARRRKNNPILVGDPGVGKTAVVEGLALKIVEGHVPDALKNVRLVGLDMGRLQAGASVKGEFERRLKAVIDEVKAAPTPTILFIDEAHTLVGSGNAPGGGDGANLLKPALARGEMRTIAATTWGEYKKYFEKDAALARRFQLVKLDEPSLAETVTILRGIVPHYEKSHGVYVRDDAVIRTAELAGRYITGRQLPDKAIDVLDTACARVKVSLGGKPPVLEALEEELASLRRELAALERDRRTGVPLSAGEDSAARHAFLQARCAELGERAAETEAQWQRELDLVTAILERRSAEHAAASGESDGAAPAAEMPDDPGTNDRDAHIVSAESLSAQLRALQGDAPLVFHEVGPELVTAIVSEWTGIPAAKLDGEGGDALSRLGENLRDRIRGQDHALKIIEQTIMSAHAGLGSPSQPTGIFLLVGPSGVGKTETALAVADALFGGERSLISINMSEFQEKHTISRLIGSPPGYVGYGEGGRLTEAVRRQPYSAVLFDEVEKAHPDILHLFYQMFDKGLLADGEGREVDFRNTVIFLTSNLGSDIVTALCEEDENPDPDVLHAALQPILTQTFHPALLGRMTVVPYTSIRKEILRELTDMKLDLVNRRLRERHHIPLLWDAEVADSITASCGAVDTGARNIDHIISAHLLPGIASALLSSLLDETRAPRGLRVSLDADNGAFVCALETP
ncbi:type VI secretion system ATPase TssH [Desulfovibrio porci]|uniref:type VI secretion system ATPase TssH n=1 Tax=Desulfovibrio porci TaxID=2605782 RepID=UPI003A8C8BE4